jgi:hypothetical protein
MTYPREAVKRLVPPAHSWAGINRVTLMNGMQPPQAEHPKPPEQMSPQPETVRAGAIMTYVGCVIVLWDGWVRIPVFIRFGNITNHDNTLGYFLATIPLAIAVALILSAALAQRKRNGARIALTIAIVIELAQSIPRLELDYLIHVGYIVAVLALFWAPRSNAWYRGQQMTQ